MDLTFGSSNQQVSSATAQSSAEGRLPDRAAHAYNEVSFIHHLHRKHLWVVHGKIDFPLVHGFHNQT
jgi:hypothetical protein